MLDPPFLRRRGAVGGHTRQQREGTDREHAGVLGAELEFDRPSLFQLARTDTWVLDAPDDKHGRGKDDGYDSAETRAGDHRD